MKFRTKKDRAQRKAAARAAAGKAKIQGKDLDDEESRAWWSGWLVGASTGATASGLGVRPGRHDELAEERNARNWGGRGYGHFEEWGV